MTAYTAKGGPYPQAGVDSADGATQIQAAVEWVDSRLSAEMTTAVRDALTGTALWVGRTIWNSTTGRRERYNGTSWVAETVTKTVRIPHTWAISGEVKVASGDTDYILPFFVPEPAGQTTRLVGGRARINSGTSVTFTLRAGSADLATGLIATTAAPSIAVDADLSNDAPLYLVITGVSGSPRNLTVTVYLDYVLA